MDIQFEKDKDAFIRMYTEVIVRAFNNILTREFYQYHLIQWLRNKKKRSKILIDKHNSAIKWLLNGRDDICFQVVGLTHLTDDKVLRAISDKFNGIIKYKKFYESYAQEYQRNCEGINHDTPRIKKP